MNTDGHLIYNNVSHSWVFYIEIDALVSIIDL